jgi:hypothetical protein
MNKYGSHVKAFRARNVVEGTLAPPGDFSITSANIFTQVLQPERSININSNFSVQQVGVYSNYADGLVIKDPRYRLDVFITARSYIQAAVDLTGVLTFDPSTKNVTAVGGAFLAELAAGDFISIIAAGFKEYAIVNSVTNNNLLVLRDYPYLNPAGLLYTARRLAPSGGTASAVLYRDVSELNQMNQVEQFLTPTLYSVAAATDIVLTGSILQRVGAGGPITIPFLTKSIDVTFTNSIYFDIMANIEYTKR